MRAEATTIRISALELDNDLEGIEQRDAYIEGAIRFHGQDILPGKWLFKHRILRPDTRAGIRA